MPKPITVPDFSTARSATKNYRRFRGLDYSTDETQIDDSRSPRAVNVIADEGGAPERRWGWRTVYDFGENACVSGVFPFEGEITQAQGAAAGRAFLVHAGERLYLLRLDADYAYIEDSRTELLDGLKSGGRSQGFYMNGKLYILTGADYIVFDGTAAKRVTDDDAYCPLTSYQRKPTGGGEAYESVNMLCKWRKNRFVGDGSSTTYQLDVTDIDEGATPAASYFITGESITVQSYDAEKGTVTFASAPKAPENAGTSNVEIKFAKTTEDRNKILGCTIFAIYGLDGSSNRVFVSGNSAHGASEWFSGLDDPTYFPDINYSMVGSSDFPIMCYVKAQGELLIIKRDNRQEGTIWHHTGSMVNDVAAFPLKEGVPGYGAAARFSAANLNDDPLYLSPRGVYAPTTTYYNNMQVRQLYCRSRRVNRRLCKENGLAEAVSAVWRGWYVLVLPNGRAYVADGNQDRADNGYEWYYWEGIPAHVLRADEQTLYFGTRDGRICKFNDDLVTAENETLMRAYNDDGAAIHAEWATKLDAMGDLSMLKTMPKRGSALHLKSYARSKIQLWIRTETDSGKQYKTLLADRLTFEDIDFARFTFNTSVNTVIPLLIKKKKWKLIQIILISDAVNEGFGVYEIELRYEEAGEAKK
ncbi:hypothetical protein RX717_08840 [Intestinibacillus sp. NTUH-41-i26]|uniref:hypothetical protein n=1 Tax=Intestinibacillus sp. NTUH-41-i26 TaxID=3079303 RepID=UPI002934C34F|nr:hypothetical protein [Intestinibacillus sp. NTUH-41-i26]WOC74133.1 hypothetical protein RX717_08840 [Intestinibacillus sp. NTUH-41-i26]